MAEVIAQCPFHDDAAEKVPSVHINCLTGGTVSVEVRPFQLIAWITILPEGVKRCMDRPHLLPVIIDTGSGGDLTISEEQLLEWGHCPQEFFRKKRYVTINGEKTPTLPASAFLHSNQPKTRDTPAKGKDPHRLVLKTGVHVVPADHLIGRRLPTLGLRTLANTNLALFINCTKPNDRWYTISTH